MEKKLLVMKSNSQSVLHKFFKINVYYTSSKQKSKPKIVRKMSKFT